MFETTVQWLYRLMLIIGQYFSINAHDRCLGMHCPHVGHNSYQVDPSNLGFGTSAKHCGLFLALPRKTAGLPAKVVEYKS